MNKSQIQQVKLRFGIIGNTEALARAIDIAIQVAPTDLSVLITGESGVGKESFPQIIHQYSRRKHVGNQKIDPVMEQAQKEQSTNPYNIPAGATAPSGKVPTATTTTTPAASGAAGANAPVQPSK